ncbi:N-formylglutamate amidohydrolase [Tsuneonella deserti]|uniref:N-formylglutamate amidohydrolase n=1 Tax=Tsuneonella deserti TaxID=2035528 RepID=A0ABQ1S965_9SPHN|nr:N-formylglutamate amidohydrolase [Tsuneonella deserti]
MIAVPHAGRDYPDDLLARMRDSTVSALRLEDRHADVLGKAIARSTGAGLLVAHAPRAMLDLNRSADDMDWSMVADSAPPSGTRHSLANRRARGGLGIVPRRLPGHGEIWKRRMERGDLENRLAGIHQPYHAALRGALHQLRDRWGAALLVDLHSMPPLPARTGGRPGAEFVIGDRFGASCDRALVAAAFSYLEAQGRQAAHNRPYAGGFVLDHHAAPARGIHALQIEVCRSSYLDGRLLEPSGRAAGVARLLSGLVRLLANEVASIARPGRFGLAAE